MTKSDTKLANIDLQSAYKQQLQASWIENKVVNAFDTETSDGLVFMLSYAIDQFSGAIGKDSVEEIPPIEIWDKITHRACRSSNAVNVWYNLDFDANAVLSGVLDNNGLKHLAITNETPDIKCPSCEERDLERHEDIHICENCDKEITDIVVIGDMEYKITYVKGKFLFIKDKHGNRYEHYDISQFFYTSLDNAAKEWLDKEKLDIVETQLFGTNNEERLEELIEDSDLHDWNYLENNYDIEKGEEWTTKNAHNYIRNHYSEIKEYAIKDAILTKDLGIELILEGENLDIPMGKPFSTGYLAAEYLRANTEKKPKFGSIQYQDYFWESYYGGRFEVFKRGKVGEVVAPDINSAYPAVMAELPAPDTLNWEFRTNEKETAFDFGYKFDIEDLQDADYGVVHCRITTNPDKTIQPFARKNSEFMTGKVHYPVLTNEEMYVLLPIFLFAYENGYITHYDLIDAWLGNETDNTYYPFSFFKDLYAERKLFEKQGYDRKGQLLKIILNSEYGKTCQVTGYKRIIELTANEVYELENNEFVFPIEFMATESKEIINEEVLEDYEEVYPEKRINKNIRAILKDNEYIIESYGSGRRFNPFFASYITGLTRLELHKQVVNHGLEDNVVMFATDSIMVEKEAYDESDFEELIETPNYEIDDNEKFLQEAKSSLGKWDLDYAGNAFVVGSGVYEVDLGSCQNDECEHYETTNCNVDEHYKYRKTRGFVDKSFPKTLEQMAEENPDGIPLKNPRPLTINEVLINPERGSVSEFILDEKKLLPDFDDKRYWHYPNPDFTYLLNNKDESEPINLMYEQEQTLKEAQETLEQIQNEKHQKSDK